MDHHSQFRAHLLLSSAAAACVAISAPAQANIRNFDVPAADAARGVHVFARQAGIQVLASARDLRGKRTNAVRGAYTVPDGLRRLLAGTGLEARDGGTGITMIRSSLAGIPAPGPRPAVAASLAQDVPAADPSASVEQEAEIVVTGLRRSLSAAADVKRNSDQIVDTVVAEDIGKLPDNNAAEAIARITGVQVNRSGDEANGVLIRGLPNIATTMFGREIFTADGRGVAVQDFPAGSLAALEVLKATTAENLEGGIAGLLNVKLRRPFDLKGFTLAGSARLSYSDQAKKADPQGNLLVSNRWETGIGEIGALVNASFTSAHYLTSVRYDGFRNGPDASNTVAPASVGRNFTFPQDIGIFYNRGYRYRPSINGSLQWAPSSDATIYVDGLWQAYRGRGQDDFLGLPIRGGGRPITNVVLSSATTPDGIPEAQSLTTVITGGNGPSKNTNNTNTDTFQGAIGGNWHTGRATLAFDVAYTSSTVAGSTINFDTKFAVPVTLNTNFNVGYGQEFDLGSFDTFDPANYVFRGFYQQRTRTHGDSVQARFDGKLDTDIALLPEFAWGFRYSDRTAYSLFGDRYADQGARNIPVANVPGWNGGAAIPPGFQGSDIQPVRSWIQIRREDLRDSVPQFLDFVRANGATNFVGDLPAYDPVRRFDAREQVYTAYGQVRYALDMGFPIDGLIGARIVNTKNHLRGTSRVAGALVPIDGTANYLDILPNASLRARFTDKLQLRLSYTKSLTRPGFSQTNPSIVINRSTEGGVEGYSGSGGNADLQPIRSTNYDASLEYYFSRTGSASIAAFQRDVDGFIVTVRNPNFVDPVYGTISLFQPLNAGSGRIKGVEAAFQTFFSFLPKPFDGLGIQANLTYIDGKQQLPLSLGVAGASGEIPGVSKWTYNLNAFYEKGPISARLAYNRRSEFVTNYSAGGASTFAAEYTKAISRLDFSASVTPVEWLTITADATNLLGKPFENYFRDPVYPRDVRYESRTYSLGARFRF